ncbi:L,D-transpeptidase family protein [Thalassotalea fonticola]|uniref:L,D-transpeptidase family protein n=1 Tax=Thalassotalea fonticola TaxID=3065649 RepID=A0ABZ0GT05_9GAMM|nr:L,D-transpeptidase family protein [Colwelliaceae bacterium S1-1]
MANTPHFAVDLVKVDKSTRTMFLYAGDTLVKKYHIALGNSPKGHKEQEGDNKTPEGSYSLDYKKEDSQFYRAMHISYPNEIDIEQALDKGLKPGGFIMIHGQKNGDTKNPKITQRFNWTNGCIALTNNEMDEFLDLVDSGTRINIQW